MSAAAAAASPPSTNGRTTVAGTVSAAAGSGGDGIAGSGLGGRRGMLGKQQVKWFSFDVDSASPIEDSFGETGLHPAPPVSVGGRGPGSLRRGSFLYRTESQNELFNNNPRSPTDSFDRLSDGYIEENIITPFAQILHRLHSLRNKYVQHSGLPGDTSYRRGSTHSTTDNNNVRAPTLNPSLKLFETRDASQEILDDIDWCLERLENIQTHRSIADMASTKFKRLLNKELIHLAESSKAGSQVSEYISNTFLDNDADESECVAPLQSDRNGFGSPSATDVKKDRRHNPMSQISLLRSISRTSSGTKIEVVPKYGVENVRLDLLEPLMTNIDAWGVNIFRINELTNDHSLTAITYTIMEERGLLRKLNIDGRDLINYLLNVESHYHAASEVPYHNHLHASDVVQSVHSLLSMTSLQNVFNDLELMAALLAGAIHDVDHPGVTNQYLINTSSELALMYNDESVLENHHLAVAFKLMQQPGCDIFKRVTVKTRHKIRRTVIDLVLATDMSKHMSLLAALKTMVEARDGGPGRSGALVLDSHTERLQVLQNILHCSDLSNPTKPLELYRQWTDRIMNEFFKQGDTERKLGLDISPMCDRYTATVEKSQIGFIDFIVQPLWETWADLVQPDCADILNTLEDNRQWYHHRMTGVMSPPIHLPVRETSSYLSV